jgi:diguanylate cyclase (GGDEF)-like protein
MSYLPHVFQELVDGCKARNQPPVEAVVAKNGSEFKVAIVGLGSGGFPLARLLHADSEIDLQGVSYRSSNNPAVAWAKENGIFTTGDYRELLKIPGLDIIIDATGNHEVEEFLSKNAEKHGIELLEGLSAKLMWKMVEEREEKETYNRIVMSQQQYLYNISLTLTNMETSSDALKLIIEAAMDILDMNGGSVALFDEERGEMKLAMALGMGESMNSETVWKITPKGFTGHILSHNGPVIIEDLSRDQSFDVSRLVREGFKSVLAIPLKSEHRIVGILYVDGKEPRGFSEMDINLIGLLGTMAASAIEKILSLERAEKLAITDDLTRLSNHRHFMGMFTSEMKRARRYDEDLSLYMIDIDHFKLLNDQQGHTTGNVVLKQLAGILKAQGRETDTVARFGGEEFVMLLPRTKKDEAVLAAKRLCNEVSTTAFPGEETQPDGRLTVSIGVATYPDDLNGSDDHLLLLEKADKAMYKAKEEGRNKVTSYSEGI